MGWHGAAPDPSGYADPIPPGDHLVTLKKFMQKKKDLDWLAVLADSEGRECLFGIPDDIDPVKNGSHAWKFYMLCGAFDYPNEDYWLTPRKSRGERSWDVEPNLKAILSAGRKAMARIEDYQGKSSVKSLWSPRRKESTPGPAEAPIQESEIPF